METSPERTKSREWAPTPEQVNAYIRSLEWQMLLKEIGSSPRHAGERRAAARPHRAFASSSLLWGLVALALGCLGCLACLVQIIYEGFK